MAQELLTTFEDEHGLAAITLTPTRPPAPGGEFSVQSYNSMNGELKTLWSLKDNGRFPDIKELKRVVRDSVNPSKSLGHSDNDTRLLEVGDTQGVGIEGDRTCSKSSRNSRERSLQMEARLSASSPVISSPNVSISYCTSCRWLLRAAWLAQELVSAAAEDIASITLIPIRPPSNDGVFVLSLDGQDVWDRAKQGGFPEVTDLIQALKSRTPP